MSDEFAVAAVRRVGRERWAEFDAPEPPPVVPAPEVRGRPATDAEVPRGARTFLNAARKAGWDCEVFYARGPWLEADGSPAYIVDSIAVRATHPPTGAAAIATWVRKPTGNPDLYTFASGHWAGERGLVKSDTLKRRIKDHAPQP